MESNIKKIQQQRTRLKDLILKDVIPLREKLDDLLNIEAQRLCPFKLDETITLDNGKKGVIKEISYHTLNYGFRYNQGYETSLIKHLDEIDFIFAYSVDDTEFSITWSISGLRMKKKDTEIGEMPFRDISPDQYEIDITKKIVKKKTFNDLIADKSFFTDFNALK